MTSDVEAFALAKLELFDPLTLLKLWCEESRKLVPFSYLKQLPQN